MKSTRPISIVLDSACFFILCFLGINCFFCLEEKVSPNYLQLTIHKLTSPRMIPGCWFEFPPMNES